MSEAPGNFRFEFGINLLVRPESDRSALGVQTHAADCGGWRLGFFKVAGLE